MWSVTIESLLGDIDKLLTFFGYGRTGKMAHEMRLLKDAVNEIDAYLGDITGCVEGE